MNRSLSSFLFARTVKHGRRALASQLRPNLDFDYLLDKANAEAIRKNIALRKGVGDPEPMYQAWEKIERIMEERGQSKITEEEYQRLWDELYEAALLIPNTSHATSPAGDESKNQVVDEWGETIQIKEPKTIEHLVKKWGSLFFPKEACGERSYTLVGPLARLERNLLDYAYKTVIGRGFSPVVISDLVAQSVTKACGVQQKEGAHPMQYRLLGEEGNVLSGTAEMGIAAMLRNRTFKTSELPIRLVSQSRCYRPEISRSAAEAKLYRVHEFTKVEMFVVCAPENSDSELENIVSIQKDIFKKFKNIKARLVNMATEELGASAHRKFDIEAWMPGRKLWGEVSSASNCTDYQSRRLNLRALDESGNARIVHTCNGTAMASTRAMIAVVESSQTAKGGVELPDFLADRSARTAPLRFSKAPSLFPHTKADLLKILEQGEKEKQSVAA